MLAAFADAATALEHEADATLTEAGRRYRGVAKRAADRLLAVLLDERGRLRRSWKDGQARHAGTLEDHACLAEGLLALYEATADERWFVAARDLGETILAHFGDPDGGFFDTADDAERLVARPRSLEDTALPRATRWRPACFSGSRPSPVKVVTRMRPKARSRWSARCRGATRRVRPVARGPGLASRAGRRDRARRCAGRPSARASPRRRPFGLPAAPGGSGGSRPGLEQRAAHAGALHARRPGDGVRLPGFRVPAAGHRARGAGGAPGGLTVALIGEPADPPWRGCPGGSGSASRPPGGSRPTSARWSAPGNRERARRSGT